jgi:hypothetical protein
MNTERIELADENRAFEIAKDYYSFVIQAPEKNQKLVNDFVGVLYANDSRATNTAAETARVQNDDHVTSLQAQSRQGE